MSAMKDVLLHAIAHARAGDKGNRANISLIPYDPAHYDLLAEQVTEARVLELFAHRGATRARHAACCGVRAQRPSSAACEAPSFLRVS